ncbi:hypothetical protein ACO0QE_003192 [Hanseniaspora vineae]
MNPSTNNRIITTTHTHTTDTNNDNTGTTQDTGVRNATGNSDIHTSSNTGTNNHTHNGNVRLLKSDVSPTSMIFRNLLILEDDLRKQYKQQLLIRYVFSLFVIILCVLLIVCVYYYPFLKTQISPLLAQFLLWFLVITLMLFHLSGEYRRTIVLPRKFFQLSNKGLKQFNCKLIKPQRKLQIVNIVGVNILIELILIFVIKCNMKFVTKMMRKPEEYINYLEYKLTIWKILKQTNVNNDNDDIKIILNPKIFNNEIREGWEIYRDEFWSRERQRRLNKLQLVYER